MYILKHYIIQSWFEYLLICFLLLIVLLCWFLSLHMAIMKTTDPYNSSSKLLICCILCADCANCSWLCCSADCSLFISFYTSYSPVACNMEIPSCAICIAVPILHFIICLCTGHTYWKLQHWNPPYSSDKLIAKLRKIPNDYSVH